MTKNTSISGIGGLLLILIFWLIVLAPLIGYSKLTNEFSATLKQYPMLETNTQFQIYKLISEIIITLSALLSFVAGFRLYKFHAPSSVRFAILTLWLSWPFGKVLNLVSAMWIYHETVSHSDIRNMILTMLGSIFTSCVIAGIWTAYLIGSARVKDTYKINAKSA